MQLISFKYTNSKGELINPKQARQPFSGISRFKGLIFPK
jgi:hypothetical protein